MAEETKPATATDATPAAAPVPASPGKPVSPTVAGAAAAPSQPAPTGAQPAAANTPAPPPPGAKAATVAPAAPKKDEASPSAPRPAVVYAGLASLAVENLVVPFMHKVEPGQTLESIAKDYYGDRKKAAVIRDANKDLPGDGKSLLPGTKIKVPKG